LKPRSAKSKGRRASLEAAQVLRSHAPDLSPDDIRVVPSGVPGEDLWLSSKARGYYPFAVEVKNVEKLNFWDAIRQAEAHAKGTEYLPVVVFRRNQEKLRIILDFETFIKVWRNNGKV
jgi:predicted RecB family endonuclease